MSPIGDSGKNMQALAKGAKVVSEKRFASRVAGVPYSQTMSEDLTSHFLSQVF